MNTLESLNNQIQQMTSRDQTTYDKLKQIEKRMKARENSPFDYRQPNEKQAKLLKFISDIFITTDNSLIMGVESFPKVNPFYLNQYRTAMEQACSWLKKAVTHVELQNEKQTPDKTTGFIRLGGDNDLDQKLSAWYYADPES